MDFLNWIPTNFGFKDGQDFLTSLIHSNFLFLTIPITTISVFLEVHLGLNILTIVSFSLLVILEFISGILASRSMGIKIESKKFGRFGFKLFVWICCLFMINSMKLQYSLPDSLAQETGFQIFNWLHSAVIIYVSLEYLISVLENMAVITKEKPSGLIKIIKKKLNKYINDEDSLG